MRKGGRNNDDDDDDEDDEDDEEKRLLQEQQQLQQQLEDQVDIVGIDQPEHVQPLSFLYQPRERENAMQPLVVMPVPQPSLSGLRRAVSGRRTEMDILNGDTERTTLLGQDFSAADSSAQFAANGELLGAKTRRDDGMFVGQSPVLAALLLSGEPPASAAVTTGVTISPYLNLARVTQRTLRDLQRASESERIRQEWARMQRNSNTPRYSPRGGAASTAAAAAAGGEADSLTASGLAPARLLQQLSIGPMTQLIENPVDSQVAQPIVPDVGTAYGGKLGSWANSASAKERLGVLPGGDRANKLHRAILRVHVHQISLLDHPLVSEEERAYANLESSFAIYRSLMEQQTLPYLSTRLIALHAELGAAAAAYDAVLQQDEEERDEDEQQAALVRLSAAFSDLAETLPALAELRLAVDSMTAGLYEQWTGLQKIRKDQGGFCSTKASLVARRIRGAGGGRRGGRDDEDDEDDATGAGETAQLWADLSQVLASVPALMKRAQATLVAADKDSTADQAAAAAAAASIADQAAGGGGGGRAGRGKTSKGESSRDVVRTPRNKKDEQRERYQKICSSAETACADLLRLKGLMPEYVLRLSDTGSVTPTAQVGADEQKRRKELEALQFKVVVRVNSQVVTASSPVHVSFPSLSVDFKQYFEFRLLHQPSSLLLDVVSVARSASGFSSDTTIASVGVPLPGQKDAYTQPPTASGTHLAHPSVSALAPSVGWLSFSSESGELGTRASANINVGSSSTRGAAPVSRITGLILCAAEYDSRSTDAAHSSSSRTTYDGIPTEDLAHVPPVVPIGSGTLFTALHKGSRSTGISQRILQGFENLDPNDPRNDAWLRSAKRVEGNQDRPVFHLDGLDFAVPFGEDGGFYDNYMRFQGSLRMQLLHMRQAKPFLFSEPIPMTDAEIRNKEIFKALLAQEPDPLMHLTDESMRDAAELAAAESAALNGAGADLRAKSKISSFLDRVRQGRVAQAVRSRKKVTTTGTVAEVQYFAPVELENLDSLLPDRKRALRPDAKPRQPSTMQVERCNLLVQVVGARNVPLREETDAPSRVPGSPKKSRSRNVSGYGSSGSSGESDTEGRASRGEGAVADEFLDETKLEFQRRARTFVEVRFQEIPRRTQVCAGRSPLWKESLSIPFVPPQNDFTPANLAQVSDNIYFSLFDECTEDYSWSGSFSDGENTVFNERRYLGSFVLPFSTVWASADGKIEGVFRLDVPCINFGYVPAPPLENIGSLQRSMFQDDPVSAGAGAASDYVDPAHQATAFEALLSLVLPKRTFQHIVAGWSKRTRKQNELSDTGVQLRPAMEREFEYYCGNSSTTYMKLMITLDPILVSPPHIPQEVGLSSLYPEDKPFAGAARSWLRSVHSVSKYTKERPFKLFGANTRGFSVLLCRYLVPMRPPQGFSSRRACIHLVSLLPFMADAQSFQGESDMWCTAKEAWETGAGDEEEHATLLYNYLYYLNHVAASDESVAAGANLRHSRAQRQAQSRSERERPQSYPTEDAVRAERVFLVLGKAVPEGDSVYVMIRDDLAALHNPHSPANFVLINPCTGQMYPAGDSRCPLVEVACLATPYNVWANVQPGGQPCELSYDILNPDHWRPFFGRRLPPPATGIHPVQEEIEYEPTPPVYALDVERTVRER